MQRWASLTEQHPIEQVALISDASNQEIHRLNARAQHYRAERGELGELEVAVPGVHYGLREGDRIALIEQHRDPGAPRIENGERGVVLGLSEVGEATVQFDVTGRRRTFAGDELAKLEVTGSRPVRRSRLLATSGPPEPIWAFPLRPWDSQIRRGRRSSRLRSTTLV